MTTPILLLVVVLIGQQCSGMKIIQGFAVEIFADVFSKVRELKLPTETLKPGDNDSFSPLHQFIRNENINLTLYYNTFVHFVP